MTNREIDQIIARGERRSLLRYLSSARFNRLGLIMSGLALFALVLGESVTAGLLFVSAIVIACWPVAMKIGRYKSVKRIEFWKQIKRRGLHGEPPTGNTRLLIDKIIGIQMASAGDELLPARQAVQLVAAYERQSQHLHKVNARLIKLNVKSQSLREKTAQLQALGEAHPASLLTLEEANADARAMQKVADEIRGSCDRLEAILGGVQKTARARQLHRELDQISAPDHSTNQVAEPAFDAESSEAIERQIKREVETYLQLERETDEHLR